MKKILLLVLVSVLSSAMLFGCKKSETAAADTLIVGTNAEFPPFEYIEQGQIVGFDVDLMNEISKLTGKKVEFKNMAFDSLLIAMQTGKINCIISGMTATDERRQHVNFSTPYFVSKQAVIVPENSDIQKFEDKTIISANTQSGGRGRFNRVWIDMGEGNLFMSIVLKPSSVFNPVYANLTQYMSVVLCRIFEEYGLEPEIKWPNDVLIDGKKISGIL